ncbi:hypothetical protein [Myxosarcina sp. GI1(2024)]
MKLLAETRAKLSWEQYDRNLDRSQFERLENRFWETSLPKDIPEAKLSKRVIRFLPERQDLDSIEFEPKFNKLEIIINNLLLTLFTIIARIIASIVSPSFLISLIKTYSRKILVLGKNTIRKKSDLKI